MTTIVIRGLTQLVHKLGFADRMAGTPYGTQPCAPGGCIPFSNSNDVNAFVARFRQVDERKPILLLGYRLYAQPKRGSEGRV
eukprot:8885180-Alexandrium_andersonii.AAC.1